LPALLLSSPGGPIGSAGVVHAATLPLSATARPPHRAERPPAIRSFAKAFRDFREVVQDFPSPRKVACERGDSNPDPVTDRNLNPVKSH
jgi:hypothetical protein